ncbi:MAG TPA: SDR family NAD(P)-dependent oxidoreductase [Puia sp.]|nr:SDR family NAD(P)-dependent oxidoreductase [Puia sp.]
MKIEGKTILISGASRGIGFALVEEALKRGAKQIYAGARTAFTHPDRRVTVMTLNVTDEAQIRTAAEKAGSLDILINNAGVLFYDDLKDRTMVERHLATNFFGMHDMIQAFLPLLIRSKGAVVNNLSILALAPLPPTASYCISKAAAFSMTQSLRAFLAGRGVKVHAVLAGPVDTDLIRHLDVPKASPASVAQCIFDGIEKGDEDIFPDPQSALIAEGWSGSAAKTLEQRFAALVR